MRFTKVLSVGLVVGLAAGAYAQADEVSSAVEQQTARVAFEAAQPSSAAVYEGIAADGRRIRLTLAESAPAVLVRVDRGAVLASPHWTSLIGTGTAASIER